MNLEAVGFVAVADAAGMQRYMVVPVVLPGYDTCHMDADVGEGKERQDDGIVGVYSFTAAIGMKMYLPTTRSQVAA